MSTRRRPRVVHLVEKVGRLEQRWCSRNERFFRGCRSNTYDISEATCGECLQAFGISITVTEKDINDMEWKDAGEEAKKAAENSESKFFTPREDGESVTGIISGFPHTYERAFRSGDKPRKRWLVNFIRTTDGKVGVLEFSNQVFVQQHEALAKYVNRSVVTVKRIGKKGDPKVIMTVMHEHDLTDEENKLKDQAHLFDLKAVAIESANWAATQPENGHNPAADNIPF